MVPPGTGQDPAQGSWNAPHGAQGPAGFGLSPTPPRVRGLPEPWGSSEAGLGLGFGVWGSDRDVRGGQQRQQEGLGLQPGEQQGCRDGSRPFLIWLSPNSRRCSSSTLSRVMSLSARSTSGLAGPFRRS